ncbi:MAG: putative blue pigment (indigoidine) exporter [Flavobacteriales bacterium]|jgi:probable blue pigment (indigoidine) exporter
MKVVLAYICIILIWSTTPLAIQFSNGSFSFLASVSIRMLIALIICWFILIVSGKRLVEHRGDWRVFLAGAVGLFPNMALVYWSAQYIPSGLIAVILGMYPFFVGLFSVILLKDNPFNATRLVALFTAITGLAVIHYEQLALDDMAIWGVGGILLSSVNFAFGTVWLKKVGHSIGALRQLTGTMTIIAPCFLLTWFLFDGVIPLQADLSSVIGVLYLALAGSVLGGLTFIYVLKRVSVSVVSLITLITPVVAMSVGYIVAGEQVSYLVALGCGLILLSLAIYQGILAECFKYIVRRYVGTSRTVSSVN